jgi:hypothetical protein
MSSLLVNAIVQNVGSESHTGFSNPGEENERIITLRGNGTSFTDSTTYLDMPVGIGSVMDASFDITVLDDSGNYPYNPRVDVGLDGDTDWEFKGVGYSKMGHQDLFFDNLDKKTLTFNAPGTNTNMVLMLALQRLVSLVD